jgi:hypothetical protein
MTAHLVMFSGGIGSWATAKRVAEAYGTSDLVLLFADVKGEDEDTYRFLTDAAANVGAPLVTVMDGRTIWEVFHDKRYLGNSRQANCSHLLKQVPCRRWIESHYPDSTSAVIYIGIDWSESHRLPAIEAGHAPYVARAPMCEPPYLDKAQMIAWADSEGLTPPRLYSIGMPHNNCGGGCVRAGQAQFQKLLLHMPDRYKTWERNESELRDYLDKDVTILRDWAAGGVPLTLRTFRERIEMQPSLFDDEDFGGCGCFTAADGKGPE